MNKRQIDNLKSATETPLDYYEKLKRVKDKEKAIKQQNLSESERQRLLRSANRRSKAFQVYSASELENLNSS